MKRQAILDFEAATAQNRIVRGPKSLNLMLYSAAQVEALCRIAKEVNKEALAWDQVDGSLLVDFHRQQVELLGGDEELWIKVDASLEDFKDYQCPRGGPLLRKLYQWRKDFFFKYFKSKFFDHDLPASNWITLGLDDAHTRDVVPYQITRNFKEVMRLAASSFQLDPNQYEHFYFDHDEKASYLASMRFEGDGEGDEVEEFPSCDCGCENATEEEKWKKKVQGMSMEWHFMAMCNGVPKDQGQG